MDFVDLDRVLDEFEEEEKAALSIVPGEELRPSGYIQFLEKHENKEWESVNTDLTNHNYSLENNYVTESVNVSYDEPYDCYSPSKLDSVQDRSLSPNIGKADQLVITGERARGLKDHVENRSKRGTIASKTTETQTEPLTPNTERELSSLPFPKSDIIVEGHMNSVISSENGSMTKNNQEQNNSPIYASVDSSRLFSSNDNPSPSSSLVQSGFINETKSSFLQYPQDQVGQDNHTESHPNIGVVSESVVGFQDVNDRDLDECEINMYLSELEREDLETHCKPVNLNVKNDSNQFSAMNGPDDSKLNMALSLSDHDVNLNHSQNGIHLSTEEKGYSKDNSYTKVEDRDVNELLQQDQQRVYHSLIYGKTEIEDLLEDKKRMSLDGLTNDVQKKGDNTIYEKLMFGKMEIEGLLSEVVQNQQDIKLNNDINDISLTKFSQGGEISGGNYSDDFGKPSDGCDLNLVNEIPVKDSLSPPVTNTELSTCSDGGDISMYTGIGARPKDPSVLRKNRPSSLFGLSKVNLDLPSPNKNLDNNSMLPQSIQPEESISPQLSNDSVSHQVDYCNDFGVSKTIDEATQRMNSVNEIDAAPSMPPAYDSYDETLDCGNQPQQYQSEEENTQNGFDGVKKMSRPTTLNLPSRPEFDVTSQEEGEVGEGDKNTLHQKVRKVIDIEEEEAIVSNTTSQQTEPGEQELAAAAASSAPVQHAPQSEMVTRPVPQRNLGEVAPFWVPDTEAEACMTCGIKFTLWKRRHHCRACGKVLCSQCCSQKSILRYLDNKEARVCVECYLDLNVAPFAFMPSPAPSFEASPRSPNPNNPSEYCSKVPPNQQATNQGIPPTVMVPTGVLKPSGSNRRGGEPKQVMFSDGIRPGGDLTELDGEDQGRSHRRSARAARRAAQQQTQNTVKKIKNDSLSRSPCLVPANGLPPLFILEGEIGHVEMDEALNQLDYSDDYRLEGGPSIHYAVNKNLSVAVKVINLDCCMNRVCWSFVSRGMSSVGQRELVILLELTEEEASSQSIQPPRDIFLHYHYLYEEALKGYTIQDMGHTILHQSFLGSRDNGGFLYVQPTFQCLNKLSLPEAPFAFGILLQKWEAPWAKVFPIRLLLRLGAEFRYYPCPLISVRNRKPVFYEIGHTIMNLLADFKNFQYSLSQIRGVTIHMEDKKTVISLPRNRYNDIMKVVRSSNEHVMAFGSSFSSTADSHLVCIQNEEGNYQTQAINIQNKPRQVTGASFVVFNGALKTSSGLRAKSSIVEDGVMVQVLPEAMATLKQILKDMKDHKISCGPVDATEPDEVLEIQWVDNDKAFNIGVKSYIDGMSLEGVDSVSVKSTSDFVGKELAIRWTRVYFLRQESSHPTHFDPVDLTRLTEEIAQASCTALVPHLEELRELEQIKIGLRVNLTRDAVGYEIGSKGQGLAEKILTSLDTCLIPIIHQASEEGMILELVFHILD